MPLPQRKTHRLSSWDYGEVGYYHVTICTQNRKKLLSRISGDEMNVTVELTPIGMAAKEAWEKMTMAAPHVKTDSVCFMPNHIHGIVMIQEHEISRRRTLSDLIRGFKSVTTRQYNRMVPPSEKNTLWQASFFDEIIRNDHMLQQTREYIEGNGSKWLDDPMYAK